MPRQQRGNLRFEFAVRHGRLVGAMAGLAARPIQHAARIAAGRSIASTVGCRSRIRPDRLGKPSRFRVQAAGRGRLPIIAWTPARNRTAPPPGSPTAAVAGVCDPGTGLREAGYKYVLKPVLIIRRCDHPSRAAASNASSRLPARGKRESETSFRRSVRRLPAAADRRRGCSIPRCIRTWSFACRGLNLIATPGSSRRKTR